MRKCFAITLIALMLVGIGLGQPTSTGKVTPLDANSRPVSIPYGWDSASGKYKQIGLGGAIFDYLKVDSLADIPAEGRGVKLTGTYSGTQSGFVLRNLSDSTYSVRFVPSTVDPITLSAHTSLFIPYRADCLWVTLSSIPPVFEVHYGAVK
jgi:hypothetical protein